MSTGLLGVSAPVLTWILCGVATGLVIARPFGWPEAIWAVAGAAALVLTGLLVPEAAWTGIRKGLDVYLFLAGMMLLSEVARREGLFDWLAALATAAAKGSPQRLFLLVYAVGTAVTVFLSNDATAVVLTPAVAAAARSARVRDPLPYLYGCAFVANAASFVLPISNPANLVVYGGGQMPPLAEWLRLFVLPSLLSVVATYLALRWSQRRVLAAETLARSVERPALSACGTVAGIGIAVFAAVLVAASAFGIALGLPTLVAGSLTALVVLALKRESPLGLLGGIAWSVLPLVAGLFVLVEALELTGLIRVLAAELRRAVAAGPEAAALSAGGLAALVANLANNLPVGLVAGTAVAQAEVPRSVAAAILIGIDLGPNLSVTGSLATILWLTALRREGHDVTAWQFLRLGCLVTPPALALALLGLLFGP